MLAVPTLALASTAANAFETPTCPGGWIDGTERAHHRVAGVGLRLTSRRNQHRVSVDDVDAPVNGGPSVRRLRSGVDGPWLASPAVAALEARLEPVVPTRNSAASESRGGCS